MTVTLQKSLLVLVTLKFQVFEQIFGFSSLNTNCFSHLTLTMEGVPLKKALLSCQIRRILAN